MLVGSSGRSGSVWIPRRSPPVGDSLCSQSCGYRGAGGSTGRNIGSLSQASYEVKLIHYSRTFDDKVRTFCMNPNGEVVLEDYDGLVTVNGHSYSRQKTKTVISQSW